MAFARFDRSPAAAPMSDINMTPLIDVMLVLLVIFILTAPLLTTAIPLNLPQAGAPGSPAVSPTLQIVLDREGQLYLDDQPVTPTALAERFTRAAAQDRQTEIQLRADEAVPYGRVVSLIALAQQAGLQRIGFVSQPAEPASRGPAGSPSVAPQPPQAVPAPRPG